MKENPTSECLLDFITVALESPYAGDVETNLQYARECARDCLLRGEAPYASHLLYTQPGILNDDLRDERLIGMRAGMTWSLKADKTVVYTDLGISGGMQYGIDMANKVGRPIEYRSIRS